MKSKLILPLAAFLMLPTMSSCNIENGLEVVFNDGCCIYKFGTSKCDVKISHGLPNVQFKKEISKFDITLPNNNKLKGKVLQSVTYKSDRNVELCFTGTLEADYRQADKCELKFKKSAFATPTSGGTLHVSLFTNGYDLKSIGGIQAIKLEPIGVDFISAVVLPNVIEFHNESQTRGFKLEDGKGKAFPFTGTLKIQHTPNECRLTFETSDFNNEQYPPVLVVCDDATTIDDDCYCDINFTSSYPGSFFFVSETN